MADLTKSDWKDIFQPAQKTDLPTQPVAQAQDVAQQATTENLLSFNDADRREIFGDAAIDGSLVRQAVLRTQQAGGSYGQNLATATALKTGADFDRNMSNPQYLVDTTRKADALGLKTVIESNPHFRPILNNPHITLQTLDNASTYDKVLRWAGVYDADRRLANRRASGEIGAQIAAAGGQITDDQIKKLNELDFANYFYRQPEGTSFLRRGYEGAYENVFDIGRRWGKGAIAYGGIKGAGALISGPVSTAFTPAAGAAVNMGADRLGRFVAAGVAAQDIYNQSFNDAVADVAKMADNEGNRLSGDSLLWIARAIGMVEAGLEFTSDLIIVPGLGKFVIPDGFKAAAGKIGADGFKSALRVALKDPAKKSAIQLAAKKMATAMAEGFAGEGITEFLQELSGTIITNEALEQSNQGKGTSFQLTSMDDALAQAWDAGKVGAASSLWLVAAGSPYHGYKTYKTENFNQVAKTKFSAGFLDTVANEAQKLDIKDPAEHGSVVQTAADENGVGTMFVAAQSFKETYGTGAGELANKLGIGADALEQAAAKNEEVQIKTGKAAEVFFQDGEGLKNLNQIKRYQSETLTPQQADAKAGAFIPDAEATPAQKKAFGKDWDTAQRGYTQMKKSLSLLGVGEEQAEAAARLFGQRLLSTSRQFNISPSTWLKQNNINIQAHPGAFGSQQFGSLSSKYEGGTGTVSTGDGDAGGRSYGKYQFNTKDGVINDFMGWLKKQPGGRKYAEFLGENVGSREFNAAWEELGRKDPEGFGSMQSLYAKPVYYDTAANNLKNKYGLDIAGRSQALQEVLFSNSVQHGSHYGAQVFEEAAKLAGKPLSEMTDAEIIHNIYEVKLNDLSWSSGSPDLRPGLFSRWKNERQDALNMLQQGGPRGREGGMKYGHPVTENISEKDMVDVTDLDGLSNLFEKRDEAGNVTGKATPSEIVDFIKGFDQNITFATKDINTLIGLPEDAYAQRHIIRNTRTMLRDGDTARNIEATEKTLSNMQSIFANAVLVDVVPNTNPNKSKKADARKHREKVDSFYNFYLPVKYNGELYALKVTAENYKGQLKVDSNRVDLYQVDARGENKIEASSLPSVGALQDAGINEQDARPVRTGNQLETSTEGTGAPSKISIGDMLKNVKDEAGAPYVKPDGTLNYEQGNRGTIEMHEMVKNGQLKRDSYIDILAKGDLSTVLHEFGHLFLQDFSWLANNADFVSEQAAKDWDTLKKDLDITDAQIKKGKDGFIRVEFTTAQHEKFAREFEQYIYEGNAPSLGMRRVFRKFRDWLADIYRGELEANNGQLAELSPEMRGFFDRLLATEEQIEVQKELLENISTLDPDTDFTLWEEAYERAKEILLREKLREIKAINSEEFKNLYKDTKEKIKSDAEKQPVYRAISDLSAGVIEDLPDKSQARLNIKQLWQLYGAEITEGLPAEVMSEDGILHPDDVAALYGFGSGLEMLEAMRASRPLNAEVAALTRQAMREATQPTVQEQQQMAQEAMNNEVTLDLIQKELERMGVEQDRRQEAREIKRQAKDAAAAAIAVQTVSKAKGFRNYFDRAVKNAVDSKEALNKGKSILALQKKMEQMTNQALGVESVKFKEEYQNTLSYFNKFLNRTKKQSSSLDSQELGVIQNLLQSFGLEKSRRTPDLDVSMGLAEWISLLPPAVKDQLAEGGPHLSALGLQGQDLNSLTVEQFRDVANAVRMIEHEGRRKNKLYNQEIRLTVQEAGEQLRDDAIKNVGVNYSSKNYKPLPQKLNRLADKFNSWIIGTENIIWQVDGRRFDGFMRDTVWRPIVGKAFDMQSNLTYEAQVRINGVWGEYSEAELWNMRQTYIPVEALGDRFTKMEMLAVAFNCGTEDNYRKLKDGRNWTDESIETVLNHLDERDWKAVQAVWDMLDSYYPMLNELEKRTKGIALKKVPGRTVKTKYGSIQGKYYPLKADADNLNTPARQKEEAKYNRPRTPQGHTKERTNATYAVSLDESYLYEHLANIIQDISYREAGIDASRILYNKTAESALKSTIGKDKYDELTTAIQKAISSQSGPMIAGEQMVRWLRTRAVSSLMAGKLSVASQQISGLFSSMAMIGVGPVFDGIMGVAFNSENCKFVREKSAFMRDRPKTRDRDIKDSYNRLTGELGGAPAWMGRNPKKALDTIGEYGFKLIATMDMIVSYPTWYGAYLDGLRQFEGNEAKAVTYADTAVRQSQGSGHTMDQAAFQRDGNEYSKIFSAFTTPGVALYRLMWRNLQQFKAGDTAAWRNISNVILAATAQGAIAEVLAGRPPEDDEDWLKWGTKQTLLFMASSIPIFRDWVSYSFGESRTIMSSPVAAPLESAGKLAKYMYEFYDGKNVDANTVFKESIRLAGFGIGYPQQLNIWGYNFLNWGIEGKELQLSDILRFRPKKER